MSINDMILTLVVLVVVFGAMLCNMHHHDIINAHWDRAYKKIMDQEKKHFDIFAQSMRTINHARSVAMVVSSIMWWGGACCFIWVAWSILGS